MTYVVAALQAIVLALLAPYLIGVTRAVRARLEGRAGGRIAQPWRDLRKLLKKQPISPADSGLLFIAAPVVLMSTSLLVAAAAPFLTTAAGLFAGGDLLVIVGLLLLGTVALALAGLDTGTAFGGMGSSREMTIAALVEPTLLLSIFALSTRVRSTNLSAIVQAGISHPAHLFTPVSLLAAAALAIAALAEAGRIPVDNPATHLELTMVHEAMVLEYSGRHLAVIELAAALKLLLYISLIACVFVPWGVAPPGAGLDAYAAGAGAYLGKLAIAGLALALFETSIAKMRVFRVPNFLGAALMLGLLGTLLLFVSKGM